MYRNSRRQFLTEVGQGMLLASVGSALAIDLGLSPDVHADDAPGRLTFGKLEPLVALMQETPPAKLQPMLVDRLQQADRPFDMMLYVGQTHRLAGEGRQAHVQKTIERFLDEKVLGKQ